MQLALGRNRRFLLIMIAVLIFTACGSAEQERLRQELTESQTQVANLTLQFQEVKKDVGSVQERLGTAQAQVAELTLQFVNSKEQIGVLQEQLNEARSQVTQLTKQVEEMEIIATNSASCNLKNASDTVMDNSASKLKFAPDFTLPDVDGNNITLSQLLQQHDAVVLVFYRGFF